MSTPAPFNMFRRGFDVFGINGTTCSRAIVCGGVVLCNSGQSISKKTDVVRIDSTRFEMFGFPFRAWCSRFVNLRNRIGFDWMVRGIVAIRKRGRRRRKFFRITTAGNIERTGFAISRFWNREPTWFESLPRDLKVRILADYRIQCDDSKTQKKKADKIKIDRIRSRRDVS